MDLNIADVTFIVVLPDTDPELAVTTVEPTLKAFASPEFALTVAVAGVPEVQVTLLVKSDVLASLNVPVALNCCV